MAQNPINNTASILDVDNINLDGNTISSTDANGNVILAPNGAGTISVTTAPVVPSGDRADSLGSATNSWDNVYADGISFDDGTNTLATFIDSTAWTPTIIGTTAPGVGTYVLQVGRYSRIGNIVHLSWSVNWNAHTGTGNMNLGGIPVAPITTAGMRFVGTVQWANGSGLPANPLWGVVTVKGDVTTTEFYFEFTNNVGNVIPVGIDTQATVSGSVWYFA